MPEGPECTRTARQVDRAVRGKQLVNLNIISDIIPYELNLPIANISSSDSKSYPIDVVFTSK